MTALQLVSVTEDGQRIVTDSRKVAEVFDKRHDNVLRDIEALEIPNDIHALNFEVLEIIEKNALGKNVVTKEYLLTRDGFTLLAMGYTGKKAMRMKLDYIAAFNAMDKQLKSANQIVKEHVDYLQDQISVLQSKVVPNLSLLYGITIGNAKIDKAAPEAVLVLMKNTVTDVQALLTYGLSLDMPAYNKAFIQGLQDYYTKHNKLSDKQTFRLNQTVTKFANKKS